MAKQKSRKGKTNRGKQAPPSPQPAPPSAVSSQGENLEELETEAMKHATDEDMKAVETAAAPVTDASSEEFIKRASELVALLEAQRSRLAAEKAKLGEEREAIAEQKADLERGRDEVGALRLELEKRVEEAEDLEKKLKGDEAKLNERREEISKRELEAEAGFQKRNREALLQLDKEGEVLRAEYSAHRKQLNQERVDFEAELKKQRDEFIHEQESQRAKDAQDAEVAQAEAQKELEAEREELRLKEDEQAEEAKRLRKLGRELQADRELLDEDREAFEERVAKRAAAELERKDGTIRALEVRLETARGEQDRLAQKLAEREEADRRFGAESPGEVLKRMRELEEERDKLREALGGRPSAEAAQRLEALVRKKELWESDRLELQEKLAEARDEASRRRIAVTELGSLRDEKAALESANALLHEAMDQLRTEVDTLVKRVEGKSPFPSCTKMDADSNLQHSQSTRDTLEALGAFATEVQHRMALDLKKPLYYSAEDVRSFIGGLAMSRLHLLQGISGTGKTSLPLAFAKAIGAGSELIEVQAGWRDRQDLIGHFNTFERRFYESEFLQALYKASTPYYKERPFIVVLDEMNLSHPEQYFADMLSALEQDPERQQLVLMTSEVEPAPQLLIDGGTKLKIPQNVWFIGTANHDETTKDFADKTYDRSHVMELPRNRVTFEPQSNPVQEPLGLAALQRAFDDAEGKYQHDAKKAYSFLQDELGELLGRRFRVGWGNRLERQMGRYVPVVVAAGGTIGEATDHILATKLLRKIRDRYDNRPEDLLALRERIEDSWKTLDQDRNARRSLGLIKEELHRLGHDDD